MWSKLFLYLVLCISLYSCKNKHVLGEEHFFDLVYCIQNDYHIRNQETISISKIDTSIAYNILKKKNYSSLQWLESISYYLDKYEIVELQKEIKSFKARYGFSSVKYKCDSTMNEIEGSFVLRNYFFDTIPEDSIYWCSQRYINLPFYDQMKLYPQDLEFGLNIICNYKYKAPIFINKKERTEHILLVPMTTYHSYNRYGGKSLYRNGIDSFDVTKIGKDRPLNCIKYSDKDKYAHDIRTVENSIRFYYKHLKGVKVYPDYYLEKHPVLFDSVKSITLMQHCEYFSSDMYMNLKEFAKKSKIVSLGGNQIYWKVKWNENYDSLEVHKDGQYFEGTNIPGGRWRNELYSEAGFLGVAFEKENYGLATHYKFLNGSSNFQNSWNKKPVCGHEMDFVQECTPPAFELIAEGNFENGKGGQIVRRNDSLKILSFGSMLAGNALGYDPIIDSLLLNFLRD